MILTELPDLPPRPETPANAAFRRDYVARWTKENTLLCGVTRFAEYPRVMHPLSIKMVWGGREVYRLRRRDVHVREGSYLVLNDGDEYGSTLKSERPTTSFSIFLRRGLAEEIVAARRLGVERCMEQAIDAASSASFSPHLRGDDSHVTPRMRFIYDSVMAGERSQHWLDEQAVLLVGDLLRAEHAAVERTLRLPAAKVSTRAELSRRLRLAADHIESHYEQALPLETLGPGGLHVDLSLRPLLRAAARRAAARLRGELPNRCGTQDAGRRRHQPPVDRRTQRLRQPIEPVSRARRRREDRWPGGAASRRPAGAGSRRAFVLTPPRAVSRR
jgi:hypothetical protein